MHDLSAILLFNFHVRTIDLYRWHAARSNDALQNAHDGSDDATLVNDVFLGVTYIWNFIRDNFVKI